MLLLVIALILARMYISIHSTRRIRPDSCQDTACLGCQGSLPGGKHADIKRLKKVGAMRWQDLHVDLVMHAEGNQIGHDMAVVAVHDQ
jgi:hypothetical protein